MKSRVLMLMVTVIASLFFLDCGSGSGSSVNTMPPPPVTYTIGGTVYSLSGAGLVLQNNSEDNLTVSANGTFTFTTPVPNGDTYDVTVLTQPSSPGQNCVVSSGSGTANANVTSIQVACVGEWTWVDGASVVNQSPIWGTQGTAAPGNNPGSRYYSFGSTDAAGNFWLFGGIVYFYGGVSGFNDLWEYSGDEWAWIVGSNQAPDQPGVYGTLGTAAPANTPGARNSAVSWIDSDGNFWLFGGDGEASYQSSGWLNDLWRYSEGEWTWMGGSNTADHTGSYGTQGTAAPSNIPGARSVAVSWTDADGNFWLFGGQGYDSNRASTQGWLNDLWKYSEGEWTWVSGSDVQNQSGTYGTQGVAAPSNVPGARYAAVSWTDQSGNFWVFGGFGYASAGSLGFLNDLWKYSAGEWTWMGGSNKCCQNGTYGTQGIAAPGNVPAPRQFAVGWIDAAGNFWLFGGSDLGGNFNDLWKYSVGQWTWMGGNVGSEQGNQPGIYGTQGIAAPANIPGAREEAVSWTDAAGNLWLFGGTGYDSTGTSGFLNDQWKYVP